MKVAIRTDASFRIGTGHAVRCATLAAELRSRGAEILFLCRTLPGDSSDLLETQGFLVRRLAAGTDATLAAGSGAADAEESAAVLAGQGVVDWLIVDHYDLGTDWERVMRPLCRGILAIDDLGDRDHDCDLLLDQNLVADFGARYASRVPPDCGLMLGPTYALLQPDYAAWRLRCRPRVGAVQRLLIFFGGSDAADLTSLALAAVGRLDVPGLQVDVVIGASNPRGGAVAAAAATLSGVRVHRGLPTLAPLMTAADLALGAGGTTTWERCCLGLPSLVVTLAANQVPIARELAARGLIRWLGNAGAVGVDALVRALQDAVADHGNGERSRACMELVDGAGTRRVAAVLTATATTPLRLRATTVADENLLLRWANDPGVRSQGFSPARIDAETHRRWFHERLAKRDACHIYIAEIEDGMPVGQVRFERCADGWQIGYSLDALFRRRGLGAPLLAAALERLAAEAGPCVAFGQVVAANSRSADIFRRLGFTEITGRDGVLEFRMTVGGAG